ncbi:lysine--tRNA ligase [archaeon]|jgi:lysyl-tRNA synthetase class 1|nr:lysine--tRNA ligase [archaeon]MDP6547582.1 lysine--tRNA ligase [Candidatus Woesearchaeota archaeon]|tara:strand:+ start:45249 stop:46868 length:1620 start_codon:yes stop_codon:yes gene_type:complete
MEKPKIDYYVWADKVADQLKERKAKKYVVHGMWTPSGFFHIGNARAELLIPSFVNESLKDRGLKSEQNFIIDDFDDFDKIPEGLNIKNEDFEQYLGKPLRKVPSPVEGYDSWAHFFQKDVLSALEKFGIKPNILPSYDAYKKGIYDKTIKIVLNKSEEIRKIWNDVTNGKKPKGWVPVMVICENCGKSATTKVVAWDGKELEYLCTQHRPYAQGCRHKGKLKPGKGNVKLPWRLHWAAGWYIYGTTFESAGKDHFSSGGSVDTSQAFCREIFKTQPPMQIPTEFLLVDNAKLSGSVGNVISLSNWLEFAEPELLRFMMISYQPQTVINFDLHSNKFFLLADRYDEAERVHFGKEIKSDKRNEQLKRYYELSQIKQMQEKIPVQINYSIASMVTQVFPEKPLNELVEILSTKGWIHRKTLTQFDKERLLKRLELAKNWIKKYAPEDAKFVVQEEIPKDLKLGSKEKEALHIVANALKEKKWNEKTLFEEFYNICQGTGIKNTDFFRAAYNVLLNKDRGPKLAPFILTLGKEKVIELFEKV